MYSGRVTPVCVGCMTTPISAGTHGAIDQGPSSGRGQQGGMRVRRLHVGLGPAYVAVGAPSGRGVQPGEHQIRAAMRIDNTTAGRVHVYVCLQVLEVPYAARPTWRRRRTRRLPTRQGQLAGQLGRKGLLHVVGSAQVHVWVAAQGRAVGGRRGDG